MSGISPACSATCEEVPRRQHAPFRVLPAQQRLVRGEVPPSEAKTRLDVEQKFVCCEGVAQLGLEPELRVERLGHFGQIPPVALRPL